MICECLERVRAKIDVYDYDRFSFNDHMGRVLLHLKDVRFEGRGAGIGKQAPFPGFVLCLIPPPPLRCWLRAVVVLSSNGWSLAKSMTRNTRKSPARYL